MPLLDFSKSLAQPQAIKTSVAEAAGRKVNKMFDNAAKPKINVSKTPPVQAVKVPGKQGPVDRRSPTGSRARRPDSGGKRSASRGGGGGNSALMGKGLFNRIAKRL